MNTIGYDREIPQAVLPKPPKSTKHGKPLKSGKRDTDYFQKKKIQELSSQINKERSNDFEQTNKLKKYLIQNPQQSQEDDSDSEDAGVLKQKDILDQRLNS